MTFGEGEYRIGVDIPPGRYRAVGYSDACTWRLVEELSRSITEPGQNVGYAGPNFPITVVDLTHPRALTFSSAGCGTWTTDLTPLVLPGEPFGDGTFLVGAELAPGRYRASASPDTCRWFLWDAPIDGGGSGFGDFIGNRTIVDILPDDAGFTSHGCGTWSPQRARTTVTPGRPFGDGTFLVGPEIAPGRYRTTAATDECQWERLHHFRGQSEIVFWTGSVLAFDGWATGTLVDIDAADVGLVLTLRNAFPITLGANLGTTVTALVASLAVDLRAGLVVALTHMLFNITGIALIYPLRAVREVPIRLAEGLSSIAATRPLLVAAYVGGTFIVAPVVGIILLR